VTIHLLVTLFCGHALSYRATRFEQMTRRIDITPDEKAFFRLSHFGVLVIK
jgi:hypothetical protein